MFLFTLSPKNAEDFYIKAQALIENDNVFSLILAPIPNSSEILSSHTLFTHSARRQRSDHPAPESFDASLFYHADSNGFLTFGNNSGNAPAIISRTVSPQKAPQFQAKKISDNYYTIKTIKEQVCYYLNLNIVTNEIIFETDNNIDNDYLWKIIT